ncbi:MAG: hypothetical protein ACRKGH_09710 [Dehalogenimonas sp.]
MVIANVSVADKMLEDIDNSQQWTWKTPAREDLIRPLIKDLGLGTDEENMGFSITTLAVNATARYCRHLFEVNKSIGDAEMTMGNLSMEASAYYEGYMAATRWLMPLVAD